MLAIGVGVSPLHPVAGLAGVIFSSFVVQVVNPAWPLQYGSFFFLFSIQCYVGSPGNVWTCAQVLDMFNVIFWQVLHTFFIEALVFNELLMSFLYFFAQFPEGVWLAAATPAHPFTSWHPLDGGVAAVKVHAHLANLAFQHGARVISFHHAVHAVVFAGVCHRQLFMC